MVFSVGFSFEVYSLSLWTWGDEARVRGIRSFGRRKSILNWLLKSPADICFLQETYSTLEVGI